MSAEIDNCKYDHDDFCFVCGLRIFHNKSDVVKRPISAPKFIEGFKNHFNCEPKPSDWSPNVSCENCYKKITSTRHKLDITSPMEWFEPQNHPNDCYFCQTEIPFGTNRSKRSMIVYGNVPSVKKAKFTSDDMEIENVETDEPSGGEQATLHGDETVQEADNFEIGELSGPIEQATGSDADTVQPQYSMDVQCGDITHTEEDRQTDFSKVTSGVSSGVVYKAPRHMHDLQPPKQPKEIIILTQARMNDMVRDLDLPKEKAELLASRLTDLGLGERMYLILNEFF